MAEMIDGAQTVAEPAPADPAATPRTFTQEEVSALCAKEAGRAERAILKQFGLSSKDGISDLLSQIQTAAGAASALQTVTGERDTYKSKYESACAELSGLKNTAELAKYGITDPDEAEFYAYKIGKLTGEGKDFAGAAAEYFAQHPVNRARVTLMHEGGGDGKTNTLNDRVNRMLRGEP